MRTDEQDVAIVAASLTRPDDALLDEDSAEVSEAQIALLEGREDIAADYRMQKKTLPRLTSLLTRKRNALLDVERRARALLGARAERGRERLRQEERRLTGNASRRQRHNLIGKLKVILGMEAAVGTATPHHPTHGAGHSRLMSDDD